MRHFCFLTGLYSRYDVLIFERQGKSLVEAGFRVTYIVCDDKSDETVSGIEIISTGFKPKSRWDRFLNTGKVLLKAALKVDADVFEDAAGDSDTVAGLLLELKGEFPALHEVIEFRNYSFEILEMNARRILKVKVTVHPESEKAQY